VCVCVCVCVCVVCVQGEGEDTVTKAAYEALRNRERMASERNASLQVMRLAAPLLSLASYMMHAASLALRRAGTLPINNCQLLTAVR
jgi:hypothetical protein